MVSSVKSTRLANRLNLRTKRWETVADLNYERYHHASCALGAYVYVFCGLSGPLMLSTNTIEKLDATRPDSRWTLIHVPETELPPRYGCIAAPLNNKEIVILGGA